MNHRHCTYKPPQCTLDEEVGKRKKRGKGRRKKEEENEIQEAEGTYAAFFKPPQVFGFRFGFIFIIPHRNYK